MVHEKYMPFTEEQLLSHFADVKRYGKPFKNTKHLDYFRKSKERYISFCNNNPDRKGKPYKEIRFPCQIEKDEKFWVAACMMTIFHNPKRTEQLVHLLKRAYGDSPPLKGTSTWEYCLSGDLHLFFEANLPSPRLYKKWVSKNLSKRHFIPHVLDSAYNKTGLEGATDVDALLVNSDNGFAVLIEAKVLSDISYDVTFDVLRNQIVRNIDVMLEKNEQLCDPLDKRDPEKTLFLLLTPKVFKDNPGSRLYGYKFNDYKSNPQSIAQDLPHRLDYDWQNISSRLGWLTWEDFHSVNKDCCVWLEQS